MLPFIEIYTNGTATKNTLSQNSHFKETVKTSCLSQRVKTSNSYKSHSVKKKLRGTVRKYRLLGI